MNRIVFVAVAFGAAAGLLAQDLPEPIKVDVNVVTMFCAVRDKKGGLVPTIAKQDFQLFEDGKAQAIKYFTRETDLPLTIGLLVDVSGSQVNLIDIEKRAATAFFQQVLKKKDVAFVISFGADSELLQDITASPKLLQEGLDRLRLNAGTSGFGGGPVPTASKPRGTVLYDAVYLAANDRLAREVGRKVIVLITDGDDQGSDYSIKQAIEQIGRLNARPGAAHAADNSQYVLPDLLVEADEHGVYQVRLLDEHTPQLAISRLYQKYLKSKATDATTREFIQKKIQSARWLIESIEQRRNTLLKVAKAIIEHQQDFLDKGPEFIEPLKMQQIADKVHVHVTTVSRAVDDKWVQTPRGIFALKRFFGGGTTTADGEEVAWDTIKQKLLEIIAKEDKQSPLSDEEIVEALAKGGFPVARRTVTKYRKALRISSSRQRKQF